MRKETREKNGEAESRKLTDLVPTLDNDFCEKKQDLRSEMNRLQAELVNLNFEG